MSDPKKIIWKYKNNHRRTQYNVYIFIGNVENDIMKILDKIKELNLYNTFVTLSKTDIKKMETFYGDYWYKKFFNTYHINYTISLIKDSIVQKKDIRDKFGEQWVQTHIESRELVEKKLLYSYETMIKNEQSRKNVKKGRTFALDDEIDLNYMTYKKEKVSNIFNLKGLSKKEITRNFEILPDINQKKKQEMNSDIDSSEPDTDSEIQIGGNYTKLHEGGDDTEDTTYVEEGLESSQLLSEEEIDLEEIDELYKNIDVNPDDDITKTTSLIMKALQDTDIYINKKEQALEFDSSKDNNMYDELLKDIFNKFYIIHQYIYEDDTIKVIKDKICCSMKNNAKFDKDSYLIPSRQYMWGEYYYTNIVEKIMIGQKWIRRNELLNIDVEPNSNIRYYEELRGNLKILRDNLKRYGNKIRFEDDDNNILYDYKGYINENELFMIDVYNELGNNYNQDSETIKNLYDVYLRLYFHKIKFDDIRHIVDYCGNEKKVEMEKMTTIFNTINNDLIINNEIMNVVDKIKDEEYKNLFKETYIIQSVIHVNLRIIEGKIDLYRIFNEFVHTEMYPFLQYQIPDGTIFFKFMENDITQYLKNKDNTEVLSKWFENSPYGLSFKVKINNKNSDRFIAINLNESGRIEYKTQWKEEEMATIDDIKKTYLYVNNLIKKINNENNKLKIDIPDENEFKYAFINTIQKFELPENFGINHNDLSEFSRFFYPYVALVIEPRKRQAKVKKGIGKSKFGTYLRFKRISKYENQQRLEQRIMYFFRNYEYNDQSLANEISKQFNITEERAMDEIDKIRIKYPNIKLSRKFLKKLENIPKYKPPGIGIAIQGKQRDKYKIIISGARDKDQLDRIIKFMNILIYLYIETYLYKKPDRQALKQKLKELTNIAKRRNKVDEIVYYSKNVKTIKHMTQIDKKRIGFKPEKGQNQWTRSCQNSGNDKKRRPQQYGSNSLDDLVKAGYLLNKKTGVFEKRVITKINGKKQEIALKTIKVKEFDENGKTTGNDIHYVCGPEENGDHMYVGFLTRSSNPNGFCMPCCFKKDPTISKNKEKRKFFLRCLGQSDEKDSEQSKISQKSIGDRLYILQDTNKIQEGRFGFLPKYLDFYFNGMLDNLKKIKHHYLVKTDTGYFFKYGSKQDDYQFLNAIAILLDLQLTDLIDKIIESLEKDKNDLMFISLNNGDIKTQFKSKDKYIDFVKYSRFLDFDIINSVLSIPGVINPEGLNILVFHKKIIIIDKMLEKEIIKEDFFLLCQNIEDLYSLTNPKKKTVFILKENKNYYPIVMVKKCNELNKNIEIQKIFKWDTAEKNIVNHVKDFYERNCYGSFLDDVVQHETLITARETYHVLNTIYAKNKKIAPKYQIVDIRNKCKYLITTNNLIIPVRPSGSIYNLQIIKSIDKYIDTFSNTLAKVSELYNASNKKINIKAKGIYFDEIKKTTYRVIAIITKSRGNIPVIPEFIEESVLNNAKLVIENKPLYDTIDKDIAKGKHNFTIDDRINNINYDTYYNESYELFRLEFSNFINKLVNLQYKNKLDHVMTDVHIEKQQKIDKIRLFIYKFIDKSLYDKFKKSIESRKETVNHIYDVGDDNTENTNTENTNTENTNTEDTNTEDTNTENTNTENTNTEDTEDDNTENTNTEDTNTEDTNTENTEDYTKKYKENDSQKGGKVNKIINMNQKIPNLTNYQVSNDRNICETLDKNKCQTNVHCHWTQSGCYLSLTQDMIITFVNKISEELSSYDLKAFEIMRIGNYFVSDIVDNSRFTDRPNQQIIKSSSNTIKKVLNDLFGLENIPKIGKRRGNKHLEVNYQQMNIDNPMKDMKNFYLQHIINNNLSIFRAYVNGYYWLRHSYYDINSRNLGYYSQLQTDLSNYFRSLVIDWLQNNKNKNIIETDLIKYMGSNKSKDVINDFLIKLGTEVNTLTNCIVELYILNKIQRIPIIIFDENQTVIYIYDDGLKYHYKDNKIMTKKEIDGYIKSVKPIQIRFIFITQNIIPDEMYVIYN